MKITDSELYEYGVKSAPDTLKAEGETTTEDIKGIFDRLPKLIAAKFNTFVEYVTGNIYTKEQTHEYVTGYAFKLQHGGMNAAIYDSNGNGVVDNAEKLDGHGADYFAKAEHGHTADKIEGGTFGGSVAATSVNRSECCLRNSEVRITDTAGARQSTDRLIFVRK